MKNRNLLVISIILILGSNIGFVTLSDPPKSIWITLVFIGSCLFLYTCIKYGLTLKKLLIFTFLIIATFLVSNFFLNISALLVYFVNSLVGSLLIYSLEKT
ncbi:hypothetical protein K5E_23850 [Enterococcus thailandicus]|uniref:Uncharacterized protein n=2 Tax=root TaxID=1 RepID=A0A510WC18_ENTTH|nr:hypothetical protein A5800_002417 [Enterococcus sp. 5B7_DIV0075]GEK36742.1 hypothetical protein ETH01_10290 [Enterococcus thailandicus]GMC00693.1 hypothetical protein K2F_09520 [Enterococcus thailandicus]GMC03611.1 hypothetical protein K4E_11330 [Enterococcus thailandicus]GMC10246.1 hypothetical protein K5E_23850 [Enterococcus thailandicus]